MHSERHSVFVDNHPVVPATYFAGTLLLSAFVMQPVCLALSLVGAICCTACLEGMGSTMRRLRWQVPLALAICAGNVLVAHTGDTILFWVGPVAVRLEPLAYGLCMGIMLVSVMQWFECASCCLDVDKVLSLGGGVLPTVSTMISMALALVPQLLRRSRQVEATLDACTAASPLASREAGEAGSKLSARSRWRTRQRGRGQSSLNHAARLSNLLMSWSLEDSLVRADSMRARGWESGSRRTTYRRVHFGWHDMALELAIVVLAIACCLLGGRAAGEWHFYPLMPQLVWWWGYVPYGAFFMLPTLLSVADQIHWIRWENSRVREA